MRKSLGLALAMLLGLSLTAGMAWARPTNIFQLYLLSFGEPSTVGVLTSAGASVTNSTTAAPFSLNATTTGARVVTVQCDAVAFVGFGSTCGTTLVTSNGCFRIGAADGPRTIILQDATTAMNAAGPAAFNCVVTRLN